MSRLPPISRKDLPDHASDERVDRIWGRVREGLPRRPQKGGARGAASAVAAIQARSTRPAMWLAAAAMMFATGVAVGKFMLSDRQPPIEARPTGKGPLTDVFAAGSRQRTFSLPGGGRLVLEPDSLVEVVELSDKVVTLSLLRGAASVDSAELPIDVVAGEARVSAPAGSSVSLARREADIDVLVAHGSVDVTSPAGHQVVKGGHVLQQVPTVTKVSLDNPRNTVNQPMPVAVAPRDPARRGPSSLVEDATAPPVLVAEPLLTVVEAPASASWKSLAAAGQYEDALALLDKGGGLEAAIGSAQSAAELMYLSEVAGGNKKPDLTRRALRRVADEFDADPSAAAAAYQLAVMYEASDKQLAAKYRVKAMQAKALAVSALCDEVVAHMGDDADPKQAVRAASEYLKTQPVGACADDARTILEYMSGKVPPSGPYGEDDKKDDKDKTNKEDSSKPKKDAPASSPSAPAPPAPSASGSSAPAKAAAPKPQPSTKQPPAPPSSAKP